MKQLFVIFSILISSVCLAQNSGSIHGLIMDGEMNSEPLMYANVSIDGTNLVSSSDENGLFHFENLTYGNYTLVYSFAGYETKELKIEVVSNKPTNVSVSLVAKTISLADLASLNSPDKGKE